MADERLRGEFVYREYVQREGGVRHAPYNPELTFYNMVRTGNVEKVRELCAEPLSEKKGLGELSGDPVANIRYHFIITAAMLARTCIDGGLELPLAYTLSDYYIRKADGMRTVAEISALHPVMCADYAERMKRLGGKRIYSRHIITCIEYIYDNLHTRITLERLSEVTGLAPAYLSRLFKRETGCCVSRYITDKKLETAENMLAYSDYPLAWISNVLAFSSQSYFTDMFRKRAGMTPLQYRSSHRR